MGEIVSPPADIEGRDTLFRMTSDSAEIAARLRSAGSVFAEEEAELLIAEAGSDEQLGAMVAKRMSGLPLEQIVGWAEFCGLRVAVEPGVFVPRRRSEFMVSLAADLAEEGAVAVDLCCGTRSEERRVGKEW